MERLLLLFPARMMDLRISVPQRDSWGCCVGQLRDVTFSTVDCVNQVGSGMREASRSRLRYELMVRSVDVASEGQVFQ